MLPTPEQLAKKLFELFSEDDGHHHCVQFFNDIDEDLSDILLDGNWNFREIAEKLSEFLEQSK